jgi:Skp family chaperone for outer membrane proteins
MKAFSRPLLLLVAAVLVAAGIAGGQTASSMMAKPTAVAVVDLKALLENLDERTEREADVTRERERLQQEAEQRRQEIQQLRNDLDVLKPGTEKQAQLQKTAIELNVWTQYQQQKVNRETGLMIEDLYRKCLDAIGRTADDLGYDAVLFKEGSPDFNYENPQQLSTQIQVRKLLWSSDEVDITAAVAQRMNNAYNNQ